MERSELHQPQQQVRPPGAHWDSRVYMIQLAVPIYERSSGCTAMLANLIAAWLVLTVLSIGFSVSVGDLVAAIRQYGLLLRAMAAKILLVPALALAINLLAALNTRRRNGNAR